MKLNVLILKLKISMYCVSVSTQSSVAVSHRHQPCLTSNSITVSGLRLFRLFRILFNLTVDTHKVRSVFSVLGLHTLYLLNVLGFCTNRASKREIKIKKLQLQSTKYDKSQTCEYEYDILFTLFTYLISRGGK